MVRFFLTMMLAAVMLAGGADAQSAYRIKPGDVLAVEVIEDSSLNRQALVLPDGQISFPLAGTVPVAGKTLPEAASAISAALAPNFAASPNVFVSVASLRAPTASGRRAPATIEVCGIGELNTPGCVEVKQGTRLLQYLAAAGGFTKFAATKRVQLRRRDPQSGAEHVYPFNYHAVTRGAKISGDYTLRDGDVIVVPERRLFE